MRSYLIVGNQTLMGPELAAAIAERIVPGDPPDVYVVVPATPQQGAFTWSEEEANAAAQERLDAMLNKLSELGIEATGEVGYRDPVEAARDALRRHPVDEIVLSTLPAGISRWLGQDVPSRLKAAVPVPVVVVTAERAPVETEGH
jgi:nucleotide-binding universal stress UspA family protein